MVACSLLLLGTLLPRCEKLTADLMGEERKDVNTSSDI